MIYKHTTQVPNFLLDTYLPQLTESELKILLTVIRQTIGWMDKRTGGRKVRDRISVQQFRKKTGLSKRTIAKAVQSLLQKALIQVSDFHGKELKLPLERKGKSWLYFAFTLPVHLTTTTSAQTAPKPVHKSDHNKTNYTKTNNTKLNRGFSHISKALTERKTLFEFIEN